MVVGLILACTRTTVNLSQSDTPKKKLNRERERVGRKKKKKDFSSIQRTKFVVKRRSAVSKHREMQMAGERMRVPLALFFFFSYVCLFGHVCVFIIEVERRREELFSFCFFPWILPGVLSHCRHKER